jgi:hypothetical protein
MPELILWRGSRTSGVTVDALSDAHFLTGTPRRTQLLSGSPSLILSLSRIPSYGSEDCPLYLWTPRNRPSIAYYAYGC